MGITSSTGDWIRNRASHEFLSCPWAGPDLGQDLHRGQCPPNLDVAA